MSNSNTSDPVIEEESNEQVEKEQQQEEEEVQELTEEELAKREEAQNAKNKLESIKFEVPQMTLSTSGSKKKFSTSNLVQGKGGGDTIMPKDQGGREKVKLESGHSHLDWIRLTNDKTVDLSGVGGELGKYTKADVKKHKSEDDAWTIIRGVVYNITPYLKFHPGGEKKLMMCAGRDGTPLFNKYHAWVNIEFMMAKCVVGFLVAEEED